MTFGVTNSGFVAPTGADVFKGLTESFLQQFGSIETTPQSITGQFIAIFAQAILEMWQALQACYNASYPATAQGVALDGIAQIVGISRKASTRTTTYVSCYGTDGTVIPAGSLVASSNSIFETAIAIQISSVNASNVVISVPSPTASLYQVIINNIVCNYLWYDILFSAPLIVDNVVSVSIGGVFLGNVPFNTSSQQTVTDICTLINNAVPQLATATVVSGEEFTLAPTSAVPIEPLFTVTGGSSQATITYGYAAPDSIATIQAGLVDVINSNAGASVNATVDGTSSIAIQALFFGSPFTISVQTPLTRTSLASPVLVFAQLRGAVPAVVNTITTIVSPVYGWQSVNNPYPPNLGSDSESDANLRTRIFTSSSATAYATVSAITSRIANVSGVEYVQVLENTTLTQQSSTITFSSDFSAGNTITIQFNGAIVASVLFNTSQAVTMQTIIAQLLAFDNVDTAGYSGDIITINWVTISSTTITSVTVVGGTTIPSATWVDGVPALAIECVVVGGSQQEVADAIYNAKAAGVQTFGNIATPVTTVSGGTTTIYYQQPHIIYIWVTCSFTGTASAAAVQQAFLTYGETLGVGQSIYYYIVNSVPSAIAGVTSATVQIGFTQTPNQAPTFSTNNIAISVSQISNWSLSRIQVI